MENKRAAILVLAMAAAVALVAGGAYATARQAANTGSPYTGTTYGYGMGPGMMGGYGGHPGVMGGYGMMGGNGYSMYQYMEHYWNSTSVP